MPGLPLTLITITKDDRAGVARTLASTHALRAAGIEQIVVDGSADSESAAAAAGTAPGVRWLPRPARGIADAFNAGIAAARGDWIWCLNGGDRMAPTLPVSFLLDLLAHTAGDVVIGGLTYEGEAAPRAHPPTHLQWPPVRSWIPHPATLVRRSMFERHGGFDERYSIAMDYEWWLRAIPSGARVDVLSVPLAVFAAGGLSQQPEMRRVIAREQRHALRRHLPALVAAWAGSSARGWRLWARALLLPGGPRR